MYPYLTLGSLIIPTYFLLISIGSFLGLLWFFRRTPTKEENTAVNIAIVGLFSGFIGARLLHIFFEEPAFYWQHPLAIFAIWQGGFVFYGGLISAYAGSALYIIRHKLEIRPWLDRACLPTSLAYLIGRIGCFANGCCYGRICFLPWAVRFPSHHLWGMSIQPRHPTELYAATGEVLLVGVLVALEQMKAFKSPGRLFGVWLILHGLNRLVMEHWRDDDRGSYIVGQSISTWISLALILGAISFLILAKRMTDLRPKTSPR